MSGYGGNQTRRRYTKSFDNRWEMESLSPEVRLIVALISRAGLDYLNGDLNATLFVWSPDFVRYCELIDIDAGRLRSRLERTVRQYQPLEG